MSGVPVDTVIGADLIGVPSEPTFADVRDYVERTLRALEPVYPGATANWGVALTGQSSDGYAQVLEVMVGRIEAVTPIREMLDAIVPVWLEVRIFDTEAIQERQRRDASEQLARFGSALEELSKDG